MSEPRIIGLLSYYDERPEWLETTIRSLRKVGVDHLVAVDGAYALLPDAEATSPPEQRAAIERACADARIGLTYFEPTEPWPGNEVEKRTKLFALGQEVAVDDVDWFMVIDADEVVKRCPADVRQRLAASELDAATVTFEEPLVSAGPARRGERPKVGRTPLPIFFRALEGGIRVIGNHYTYIDRDGRKLWGHGLDKSSGRLTDYLPLTDLVIDHRTNRREARRRAQQRTFYERREQTRLEYGVCWRCDRPATEKVVAEPEIQADGYVAAWHVLACDEHGEEIAAETLRRMALLDIPADYFALNDPVGLAG